MRITGVSLLFSLVLGLVFAAVHLFNSWAFSALEFSSFISLVYLPGFLRLANVLVMGPLWGSLATAFGHLMLILVELRPVDLALVNLVASVLGALLAALAFESLHGRRLHHFSLMDLFKVALLYTFFNASCHHLAWSMIAPELLIQKDQWLLMVIGDFNGALLGAFLLRTLARRTGIVAWLRRKAE